ncbi:porin [Limnohabitans sp. DCL3]|uniref:porin n=1 Tax=Limnohabitans sp. DCL3 TaxID=3374103 RepID=UPI003A8C872F
MKKTLIALAVLAASGAAFAQSNVTLSGGYGLVVGTSKTGTVSTGTQIARQTGNLNFAGVEDLGGGLKAAFQLQTSIGAFAETKLNNAGAAAAATTLGDRGANVSLSGGFGTAFVGRGASAVRGLWGAIGDVSQMPVLSGISAGAGSKVDAGARVIYGDAYSNYVAYSSPAMNGFSASVALAGVDGTTAATKDTTSFTLQYANGPLAAAVNLTDSKQTVAAGAAVAAVAATQSTTSPFTYTPAVAAVAATPAVQAYKMTTILASYDFGVAKVGLTSQQIKLDSGVNPGDAMALTVAAPIGAGIVSAGFGKRSASGSLNEYFGDDVKQTFVGYRHNLSKRTAISLISNKIDRSGAAADVTETSLVVGHTF